MGRKGHPSCARPGDRGSSAPRAAHWAGAALASLALLAWVALLWLTGCASGTSGGASAVRDLHLLGVPVAVSLDRSRTPNGFAVRVYASNGKEAKGISIRDGKLELLLYDGAPTDAERAAATPLRTWSFDARKLREFGGSSAVGWGYRFALPWGDNKPTGDRFAVVARYTAPSGGTVTSSPGVITMTLH